MNEPENGYAAEHKLADELAAENLRLRKIAADLLIELEVKRETMGQDDCRPTAH